MSKPSVRSSGLTYRLAYTCPQRRCLDRLDARQLGYLLRSGEQVDSSPLRELRSALTCEGPQETVA